MQACKQKDQTGKEGYLVMGGCMNEKSKVMMRLKSKSDRCCHLSLVW
jgi:hypothetical protein